MTQSSPLESPPAVPEQRASRVRPPVPGHRFFNRSMAVLALIFTVISAGGMVLAHLEVRVGPLFLRGLPLPVFLLGIVYYRWRREERIVNLLTIVSWAILFGILYVPPEYIAARCQLPLADAALARADEAFGLRVPDILAFMDAHAALKRLSQFCYDALLPFVVFAIMAAPFCKKMTRAKEFTVASLASALIAFPLSAIVPAVGPWFHYGYAPAADQEKVMNAFLILRSGEHFVINFADLEGVIAFPSFHTVLAILAAFALWPLPYVRWAGVVVCTLIVIATVTTGWHYAVDVAAGVAVAGVSCWIGRLFTSLEKRRIVDCPGA